MADGEGVAPEDAALDEVTFWGEGAADDAASDEVLLAAGDVSEEAPLGVAALEEAVLKEADSEDGPLEGEASPSVPSAAEHPDASA